MKYVQCPFCKQQLELSTSLEPGEEVTKPQPCIKCGQPMRWVVKEGVE